MTKTKRQKQKKVQKQNEQLPNSSRKLLETVSDWKLEAKLEDNDRYFFHTAHVDVLESGSRCYVIGRKGSGKTAISEYLHRKRGPKRFSQKLTFKNFPFNDLYQLENTSFTPPNQYITLWKYLIYSSIARLMLVNENIDSETRSKLAKIYSADPITSLSRTISRWTSRDFQITILGSGVKGAIGRETEENKTTWIERVEILEKLIEQHIDDSTYSIIFDELDEDYKDISATDKNEQYTALLTSLFKAVQDIKSIFPVNAYNIRPIVFLRDDIYDNMRDPDKTKWGDLSIELDWNPYSIRKLLAFRISRANDPHQPIMPFEEAWGRLFSSRGVLFGHRKIPSFDFITYNTLIRPRDYVRYLRAAAEHTLYGNLHQIGPEIIKKTNSTFSNYLRSELEDEIHSILPEVKIILDIIAHIRRQVFSFGDFHEAYEREVERGSLQNRGAEYVLNILFHFSVIGNQSRNQHIQIFRYLNKEARFSAADRICVHRGLFKSLQIF